MFSFHQSRLSYVNYDCNEQLCLQSIHLLLDERQIQERFQICVQMYGLSSRYAVCFRRTTEFIPLRAT